MVYGEFIRRQIVKTMTPILSVMRDATLEEITEVDIEEVEQALTAILSAQRIQTMCVSVEEALDEHEVFGRRLGEKQENLADTLDRRYGFKLLMALGADRYNALQSAFQSDVPVALLDTLQDPFAAARRSAAKVLFYYAGFSMAGDAASAQMFSRLAMSFVRAVPVSQLPGRPNMWTVLVRNIPGNPMVIAM